MCVKGVQSATFLIEGSLFIELEQGEAEFTNLSSVLVLLWDSRKPAHVVHCVLKLGPNPKERPLHLINSRKLVQVFKTCKVVFSECTSFGLKN